MNKFIPMKILQPLLAALTLCITPIANGVEYKTLKTVWPGYQASPISSEIDVLPTDIVEVVSASGESAQAQPNVTFQYQDGSWSSSLLVNYVPKPIIVTGITKFRLLGGYTLWVTLKITPAEAVAPTTVLVLPETPGGNYDLVVESSGDTVTWAPFHSQAVLSGGANAFFRVRIVKK
jgi:hypothetical protein